MGCDKGKVVREADFSRELVQGLVFHRLALLLSACFMSLSVGISLWLILHHALHYSRPYEQKHIIRILAMIPIYSVISFLSLIFYHKDVYLELVRNCYEAYVIASFFTLMCHYTAPTLHEQKDYFRNVQPKPWVFPLTRVRTPRSGLTWFNVIYVSIFQFCITRPFFTLVAIIAQTQDRYCDTSTRLRDGHIWIALLQGACILIAMYCMVQFHVQIKEHLAPHKPVFKVLCIKLVMFLCFWQTWLIGLLSLKGGPLVPTAYIGSVDIHIGIPCILICFEMTVFATLHHWAFAWEPYALDRQLRGPVRLDRYACRPSEALLDALNPWDYAKAAARGFRWLFHDVRYRKDDRSYQTATTTTTTTPPPPPPTTIGEPSSARLGRRDASVHENSMSATASEMKMERTGKRRHTM